MLLRIAFKEGQAPKLDHPLILLVYFSLFFFTLTMVTSTAL